MQVCFPLQRVVPLARLRRAINKGTSDYPLTAEGTMEGKAVAEEFHAREKKRQVSDVCLLACFSIHHGDARHVD